MSSRKLFKDIITGNLNGANDRLESLLFNKMGYALEEKKKFAKVTDKDNDSEDDSGDTLDPVGKGDADIDNDGDSDESDDYLRNRRKKINKAMKEAYGEYVPGTIPHDPSAPQPPNPDHEYLVSPSQWDQYWEDYHNAVKKWERDWKNRQKQTPWMA